jgi:drug/metabolite transporter (DMT)-like permease
MNAAVLLGLVSALCYGVTDYLARIAARSVGVWRSLFYGDLLAFAVLSAWFVRSPDLKAGDLAGHPHAWAASFASGFILLAAAASLTQGLTRGTLAVVAPVTASYGAITALLSAAGGEQLTHHAILGIALTVIGVCLVSVPAGGQFRAHLHSSGFAWAAGASVCYGVGFWLQGAFAVPALGALIPAWLSYAIVVATIPLLRRTLKVTLTPPSRDQWAPVLATGLFSAAAYVALTIGLATSRVAIVVVLSTLASAVTVLMSRVFDRAPIAKHQWAAMVVIICGLILIRS